MHVYILHGRHFHLLFVEKCLVSHNYVKTGVSRLSFSKERWENKKGKRKWKKTFKNGVEFNHPGRQNRLFGETVDIGQRTNPTLDTQSENISKVLRREAASGDGVEDSVGAQEKFRVTLNGVVKSLVGQDGRLSFQEALHSSHTTFDAMTPETKRLRNYQLLTNTWCVKSKREWDLVFYLPGSVAGATRAVAWRLWVVSWSCRSVVWRWTGRRRNVTQRRTAGDGASSPPPRAPVDPGTWMINPPKQTDSKHTPRGGVGW